MHIEPDTHKVLFGDPASGPAWQRWGLWAVQILLALAFAFAGAMKLLAFPEMVAMFDAIGAGQGFRIVTGVLEVAAAAAILIPATAFVGAALIVCIMMGAVYTHLVLIGGSAVPALILGLLAALVVWGRAPKRTLGA